MTHIIWRLHRNQVFVAGIALIVYSIVLIPTGFHFANAYHTALSTCSATGSCGNLSNSLFQGDGLVLDLVIATLGLPALLGMFWGAPLVAKEFENGTHQFAWTQSITRSRWIWTLVGWSLLAAIVYSATFSALVTWWRTPENELFGKFGPPIFDLQGIVPIGYTLFTVSLGIALGTWVRRVLPAMSMTLGIFIAVRVVDYLYIRPHYLAPLKKSVALTSDVKLSQNSWVISRIIIDPTGHNIGNDYTSIPTACHNSLFNGTVINCLSAHGYKRLFTYQPADRYWTFQCIETGLFAAIAAVCIALAVRRIKHRDA
jgi:hypothetical protein